MGAFGYLQALACGTGALCRSITAWNTMSIVFLTSKTEFACTRFKDGLSRPVQNSTCYEDCAEYEYNSVVFRETLISTFGLICDRAWLVSFTQTMTMFGLALGVTGLGWLSDRFGRQKALLLSIAIAVIFMIVAPFAPNYWAYNICRFLAGFGSGGIMNIGVVYNMEMVGPKYREIAGISGLIADGFGIMLLAAVAFHSSTWQTFFLFFGLLSILFFVVMLFMPESPRWLVSQRRTEQAIEMVTKVAKFNRLNTSHIRETVSKAVEELDTEHTEVQKRTLLDLFGTLELAKVTTVTCLVGFLGGTCYFGIHHYATLLGLDIFIIVPLMGLLQAVGNILGTPLNKYARRKVSLFCTLVIVAIMMTVLIFIPDGNWGCAATTGIAVIFTSGFFGVYYIFVNELYPTPLRSMGVGMGCGGAKVGAMVAPFIANMRTHWMSSTILAVVPFVGAALCLLLPETKGKKMKDTVD
ncbi:hypothetical protein ABMA27_001115 [Loxostege sticticalis]|uniref:Major facilitator superfamily (MFS) profile domain-containing protein n=1 Tax=Loxostege sticticalis TaxID=481309 RepID=A0ABR3I1K0_LOXSC